MIRSMDSSQMTELAECTDAPFEYEYRKLGEGRPHVVFFNGFRMPLSSWDKVLDELDTVTFGTALLYNRSGVGRSLKAAQAQTGDAVIASFKNLASHLDLEPPFVLVAHSLGGL